MCRPPELPCFLMLWTTTSSQALPKIQNSISSVSCWMLNLCPVNPPGLMDVDATVYTKQSQEPPDLTSSLQGRGGHTRAAPCVLCGAHGATGQHGLSSSCKHIHRSLDVTSPKGPSPLLPKPQNRKLRHGAQVAHKGNARPTQGLSTAQGWRSTSQAGLHGEVQGSPGHTLQGPGAKPLGSLLVGLGSCGGSEVGQE